MSVDHFSDHFSTSKLETVTSALHESSQHLSRFAQAQFGAGSRLDFQPRSVVDTATQHLPVVGDNISASQRQDFVIAGRHGHTDTVSGVMPE